MKIVKAETRASKAWVFVLLGGAVFAPLLLRPGSFPAAPGWAGAGVSALCLLAALRRLGVRRAYIFALAAALLAALLWGLSRN